MKVLLRTDMFDKVEKSGVGRAIIHQKKALELNGVSYTTNPVEDYDIVHINTVFPQSYLAAKKAHKEGKKVVMHAHSTEEDFRNSFIGSNVVAPLFKKWLTSCYRQGDIVLTPTPYSKSLLDHYHIGRRIIPISNGIELDYFKAEKSWRQDFRKEFGFSETDKVIIAVGLYIERKGILDFVEIAASMPDYKFVWFGFTNLNTVPAKVKEAVTTKLDNLFFPGYYPRNLLRKAYAGADLFFFPTYEETEGIVLLEALAAKTPVLIRDIPIYQGWFEDGKNVYKGTNNKEFKEKITGIVEQKLPNLTKEGYKVAQERSIENIGKELKKI
ncbi:MAG: glycosyltransferase family 4 protein, partial [Bacilli bacterium]|nr:glycosyltransferase family 4 protein [Bacilli bacterium]